MISITLFILFGIKIYRNQVYLARIVDIFKAKDNIERQQAE